MYFLHQNMIKNIVNTIKILLQNYKSTFDWLQSHGGMTRANGERFRKYILSVGNSTDLKKAFRDFVGHDLEVMPYLKNAGLLK